MPAGAHQCGDNSLNEPLSQGRVVGGGRGASSVQGSCRFYNRTMLRVSARARSLFSVDLPRAAEEVSGNGSYSHTGWTSPVQSSDSGV